MWIFFIYTFLYANLSHADVGDPCAVSGKSWESLVQDFKSHWNGTEDDFCQFKRFSVLNVMFRDDLEHDAARYFQRMDALHALGDKSEPENALILAFQETWFSVYLDTLLDREFNAAVSLGRGATYAFVSMGITLALVRNARQYSSESIAFVRKAADAFFQKRPIVFAGSSLTALASTRQKRRKGELGPRIYLRPPIFRDGAENSLDGRTSGIFKKEFYAQMLNVTATFVAGSVTGNFTSLMVKAKFPKWYTIFTRSALARSPLLSKASPGMVLGSPLSYLASFIIALEIPKYRFQAGFKDRLDGLLSEINQLAKDLGEGHELKAWVDSKRMKNDLMLVNYMYTRDYELGILSETESEIRVLTRKLEDCTLRQDQIVPEEYQHFQDQIAKLVARETKNLQAALAISNSVTNSLFNNVNLVTENVLTFNQGVLSTKVLSYLDVQASADYLWKDILESVKGTECVEQSGYYP